MEYLYYDSQHKQIQAILDRLLAQVGHLDVSNPDPDRPETFDLRRSIIEEARRLNRAVEELLSSFGDLPSIPSTASQGNGDQLRSEQPQPHEASTQQLEAILNNLIAGVVVYDAEGVVKFANGYAISLFGFDPTRMSRDSVAGKLEIYGEDGRRVLVRDMPSNIAATGEVVMNRPLTLRGGLGRAAHVLCSAMPVMSGGRLDGVVAVWNDVTRQHNLLKEHEHQRELLETIFESISDGIMVYDAAGQPIRANLAAIQGMGFDPTKMGRAEAVRRLTISHPDGQRVGIEELPPSQALAGQKVRDVPYHFTDPSGRAHILFSSGAPLRNAQGEITGAVTIWHDVTELEQVRQRVESERDRLKAILSSMNDEVWYCDPDGNATLMNAAVVSMLGVDSQEQLDGPLEERALDRLEIYDADGTPRPAEETPLLRALKGETVRGEEIITNLNTKERMFREYIASPVRSRAGEITGAVAVTRDISRQKQQEAELKETVAALRESVLNEGARLTELNAIMDAVPAIIFITRYRDSREVTGNRVAHEFLRVRSQANLSKSAPEAEAPHNFQVFQNGRELAPAQLPLQVSAATGRPVRDFEEDVLFDDGSQARLIGNVTPLLDEDGRPAGAVAAFLDITERVEQSTQMEVQRRLMEHREMERQKIARDLHDGPVQALGGLGFSLQILQDMSTDADIKRMIAQMQAEVKEQAQELREVINELRPPALARFGLRRAIRSYAEDFQSRHPQITLSVELDESDVTLPDSPVLVLYRIFQEGLANIARHSRATRVSVRLAIEEARYGRDRGARDIVLEIEDNGVGFASPVDWIELTRNGHFGLVGMKERAEAAGGKLAIQSEAGNGTRLRAAIPWEE